MYSRRFYRQSPPPGYSGVAFTNEEKEPLVREEKNSPPFKERCDLKATDSLLGGIDFGAINFDAIKRAVSPTVGGERVGASRDYLPENSQSSRFDISGVERNAPKASVSEDSSKEGGFDISRGSANPLIEAYRERRKEEAMLSAAAKYKSREKPLVDSAALFAPSSKGREKRGKEALLSSAVTAACNKNKCDNCKEGCQGEEHNKKGLLEELTGHRFSLEELLLVGAALLLASGDADDELFVIIGLLLILSGES